MSSPANSYDFWNIPSLYEETYRLPSKRIGAVITESL